MEKRLSSHDTAFDAYSDDDDESNDGEINLYIENYPVNAIAMEPLDNTLEQTMDKKRPNQPLKCSHYLKRSLDRR